MCMVQCAADPVPIGVGYLAQYIVKPLLGYVIAKVRPVLLHRYRNTTCLMHCTGCVQLLLPQIFITMLF